MTLFNHREYGTKENNSDGYHQVPNRVAVLEKGIEFCSVLHVRISFPDFHPMTVKGGTSLSMVYRIINRFSEDVDITLDYRAFDDDFDPFAIGISNSKIKQFSERLKIR